MDSCYESTPMKRLFFDAIRTASIFDKKSKRCSLAKK